MNTLKKISLGAIMIALMAVGVPSSFAGHINAQTHNVMNIQQHNHTVNTQQNTVINTQQQKMTKSKIVLMKIRTFLTNTKTKFKKLIANTNIKIKKMVANSKMKFKKLASSRFFHHNNNNLSTTSTTTNTTQSVNRAIVTAGASASTNSIKVTAENSETLPPPHYDINYNSANSDLPFIKKIIWTIKFRHAAYAAAIFPPTYFTPECLFFNQWYRASGTPITNLWFFNKCIYQVAY